MVSFGSGGYVAGRTRTPYASAEADEVETRDGLHGVASWALAVVIGAVLAALGRNGGESIFIHRNSAERDGTVDP
jgi:hypothetical protein